MWVEQEPGTSRNLAKVLSSTLTRCGSLFRRASNRTRPRGSICWRARLSLVADPNLEQLAREALALSAEARAELAHRLIESLDDAPDKDVEAASLAEAARRGEEIDRGVVEPITADELFRRVNARLSR